MKTPKIESLYAFALVALVVPSVLFGVVLVSAASEINNPKSTNFQLFDESEFRQLRREVRKEIVPIVTTKEEPTLHLAAPCDPAKSAMPIQEEKSLRYQDLSSTEREALRLQLRIGGCPQQADPGYKALCESMLKTQEAKKSLKGLRHPSQ